MKKIYQNPETDIITISMMQLMTTSNNYGQPEMGQDLSEAEETTATGGNLSRRNNIWDDEEEEEFF